MEQKMDQTMLQPRRGIPSLEKDQDWSKAIPMSPSTRSYRTAGNLLACPRT